MRRMHIKCSSVVCVSLFISLLITKTTQNDRHKRQILPDQPRILTQNGHLVFQSGTNHNITFKSGSGGGIFIDNLDLKNTANQVKANKDAIDRMHGGSSGGGAQGSVTQRVTNLENQLRGLTSLPHNISALATAFQNFRVQMMTTSNTLTHRLSTLENQVNNDASSSSATIQFVHLGSQIQALQQRIGDLESSVSSRTASVDQQLTDASSSRRSMRRMRSRLSDVRRRVNNLQTLLDVNECASNPCLNGATCLDLFNGYLCKCPSNWKGARCGQDVNECSEYMGTDLGCQNGATCTNTPGGFRCQCSTNWHGIHCNERHDDCTGASHSELCGHGTCVNENRVQPGQPKYRCICETGWTTDGSNPACNVDVDECATGRHCSVDPSVLCINIPGSFVCGSCPAGFTGNGYVCTDINECLVNNGGCSTNPRVNCINTRGSSTCGPCPAGYTGNGNTCEYNEDGWCATNNGNCHPQAICTNTPNLFSRCTCRPGYVGVGFGPNGCLPAPGNGTCTPNPCQNGGRCVDVSGSNHYCTNPVAPCDSNPCQNGATCLGHLIGNGFRCQCPPSFIGDLCDQETTGCGGNINADSGELRYPPTPGTLYDHDVNCIWVITTSAANKVLNLHFDEFDIEYHHNCIYDYLQINDGSTPTDTNFIGKYCGSSLPNNSLIVSTGNSIYLKFGSDESIAHNGFHFNWDSYSPGCGGTLVGETGAISSPGYPSNYPHHQDCIWTVTVPLGNVIQFSFSNLAIETHPNCSFDYVEIRDGLNSMSPILNRFCTSGTPSVFSTTGPYAYVHFHSDYSISDVGFQLTYNIGGPSSGCGAALTGESGEFTSPGYPTEYDHLLDCVWSVTVPEGLSVNLQFAHFDLEDEHTCDYDFLEVRETDSTLLGRFCGSSIPAQIISRGNSIVVTLQTDQTISGDGFAATWSTGCNQYFSGSSGQVQSPNYPSNYPPSSTCLYTIYVPEGNHVLFDVTGFDLGLERSLSCITDYVQFFDGSTDSATTIGGRYCGYNRPQTIRSTGRSLLIKFVSDSTNNNPGFQGSYTAESTNLVCGGVFVDGSGFITSPGYPNVYPSGINCTWYINVDPGFIVGLQFDTFLLNPRGPSGCVDFVDVYDNTTIVETSRRGRFCGSITPALMTSSDNSMVINMQTTTLSAGLPGFTATYSSINATNDCGEDLTEPTGVITSPYFPYAYPHGRDCIWTIRNSQPGTQISLHFTQFRLEFSTRCVFDYVEIRDGATPSSPVIQKLCGPKEGIPAIVSTSNAIRIHFHSDSSLSRPGFRLEYDSTATGCGADLTTPTGTIVSPGYPFPYHRNALCTWTISVSRGSLITLTFEDFNLESHSRCSWDYLQLRDVDESGQIIPVNGLDKVCGSNVTGNVTSTSNRLWIRLSTDSSVSGHGFVINYKQNCNTRLTDLHGVIESPNFPHPYSHRVNCTWVIAAPLSNKINVSFAAFDLESGGTSCVFDHLKIRNGDSFDSDVNQTLCGNTIPAPFQSQSNLLHFNFKSDHSVALSGFRLEYVFDGCGGIITKNSGSLTSPNYPSHYTNQMECLWRISVDLGKRVKLTIYDLDLEQVQGCSFDSLEVFSGPDVNSPRLSQLCHTQRSAQDLTAIGNTMVVKLKTDRSVTGRGFNASFTAIDGGCGGNYSAQSGTIMSPGYPNYPSTGVCEWLITVEPLHAVVLNFTHFSISSTNLNCEDSSLKVYDGANTSRPVLATLCGGSLPELIRSRLENRLLLKLSISDNNVDRNRWKGFSLNYATACGGHIRAQDNPVIVSPGYPHQVPSYKECSWLISASNDAATISLQFTNMDIVSYSNDCNDSYVAVIQGENPTHYCGNHIPPVIYGGSTMMVRFSSRFITGSGFRAVISQSSSACGGDFNALTGRFNSPGYPDNYPTDRECVWQIQTSPGNTIRLSFQSFDLISYGDVNTDYVEVRSPDVNGELLGRWIDHSAPTNLTALGGAWVKFRSDEHFPGPGFRAEWSSVHGGVLTGDSGQVASPHYPLLYPDNVNYQWTILVSTNKVVKLTFLDFVLERMVSDTCEFADYLKIYDGADTTGNVLGVFCAINNPGTLYTTTNAATLVFNADSSIRLRGFLANWTAVANADIPGPSSTSVCGGDLYVTDDDQILTSPGQLISYEDNMNCVWQLIVAEGSSVAVNITYMYLETHGACNYDYITFADGLSSSYPKFCGRNTNTEPIRIRGNRGSITFITDGSITRRGFQLTYKKDCGGVFTTVASAQISSLGFPNNYPNNANCTWSVSVRVGKTITMDFNPVFAIADSGTCQNDYLMLLNGFASDAPPLFINTSSSSDNTNGRYCGNSPPQSMETTSNNLNVNFVSDTSGTAQGFAFNFTEKAVACGGHIVLSSSMSRYIMSPNYPHNYPHHVDCVWVIIGRAQRRIQVDFEGTFTIESGATCDYDYIEFRDGGTIFSPQLGHRICGRDLPSTQVSTGSIMYIRFFADGSVTYSGFKARVSLATCGGRISAMSGEVTSPNFPQSYGSNQDCEWSINVPIGHYMTISQESFSLQQSTSCSSDYVEIREVNSTGYLLGRGCGQGSTIVTPIRTASNIAYVRFHSDSTDNRNGFKLSFNASTDVCGGDLTTPDGVITSPNYPHSYANRRRCIWRITVPEGRRITLTFEDFELEAHPQCAYDRLTVINGVVPRSPSIGQYCGAVLSSPVQSSGNAMTVFFRSDIGISGRGFRLSYNSNQDAYCGGLLTGLTGNMTNPGYDSHQYNHSTQCIWRLHNSNPFNSSIVLHFTNMNLEYGGGNCVYDFVAIREGRDENSPLIDSFCGNRTPPGFIYIPSPDVYIRYQTDGSINGDGFRLEYKVSQCGGILTSPGVISSPNFPQNYDHKDNCVWKIVAPEGTRIRVHFTDFSFENHSLCSYDYLKIFNGGLPNSPSMRRMCGNTLPQDLVSQSNVMKVVMETDRSESDMGFRMEYSFTSGGCGGLYHSNTGSLESPNYPSNYPHNVECRWDINVALGYVVNLRFNPPFDLEAANCIYDHVEVFDSFTNGTLISKGKWCSNVEPPPQISSTTRMVVVFRSDFSTNGNGFSASWEAVCGGLFQGTTGTIYSPGYPQDYANNLWCNYTISPLPPSRQVALIFKDFELEGSPDNCIYDNVTIYQGTSNLGRRKGTFCGRAIPDRIIVRDAALLSFRSDRSDRYRGFKLIYYAKACGGVYNRDRARVTSGFYGSDYLHNMNCSWHITVNPNNVIAFKFFQFDLERHRYCNYDYVAFYDGPDESSPLMGKFCGERSSLPNFITTTGNQMTIRFVTDYSVAHAGFMGYYWATYGPNHGCGGTIQQSSGSLTSFDIDNDGIYEDGLDCVYTIITDINKVLTFNITGIDIEQATDCHFDYLMVYDGSSTNGPLLGKFCGTTVPSTLKSSGNALYVIFHTDYNVARHGFNATFSSSPALCGGSYNVTTDLQTIQSIGYPSPYSLPLRCSWILDSGSSSQKITVNVTDIQLTTSQNCLDEYLQVRDLPMGDSGREFHYCGQTQPRPFDSMGQMLQVIYHLNRGSSGRGFQLSYQTADCNKMVTGSSGSITSPNYPDVYPRNIACLVNVTTPVGTFLSFYVNTLAIEYHSACNYDFVQVRNSTYDSVAKMCGTFIPNPVFFQNNVASLQFATDYSAQRKGYDITFVASTQGLGCGGIISGITSGAFTSPAYPQRSNVTQVCTWTIRPPARTRLFFTMSRLPQTLNGFDTDCSNNNVALYKGDSAITGETLGSYCAEPTPDNFQWDHNQPSLVRFSNSGFGTAPVFQIKFTSTPPE